MKSCGGNTPKARVCYSIYFWATSQKRLITPIFGYPFSKNNPQILRKNPDYILNRNEDKIELDGSITRFYTLSSFFAT
jgi:hypothetical protein